MRLIAFRPAEDAAVTITEVSATLARAARASKLPARQLHQWLWIGSQYRLHAATGGTIAAAAGAALAFLSRRFDQTLAESDEQDLNWVVETTTRDIREMLHEGGIESCFSLPGIAEIKRSLANFGDVPFDETGVRSRLTKVLAELKFFSASSHLKYIGRKIEALFVAARGDSSAALTAQAALLYFADHQDAGDDSIGLLVLLDDLCIIEFAYAVVEQQTRCLPLLMALLRTYPCIADLAVVDAPLRPLDLYSQYVCCAALYTLFERSCPSMLVVREAGPLALLAALFAGLEAARRQAGRDREHLSEWSVGQHVTVSDGVVTFKVVYLGETEVGSERRLKLGVDKQASLTASRDLAPYMAAARSPHRRLSSGTQFANWLKARHADPLANLVQAARMRASNQDCILLLGPRAKINCFASSIRPFNTDIGSVIGFRYVMDDHYESIGSIATDAPLVYACSNADTAYDLIRNPPPQVRNWRVIVDGAEEMRALFASLTSDGGQALPPMCVVAELFDREASAALLHKKFQPWYLEDLDVQPPPDDRSSGGADPVVRMLERQGAHWNVVRRYHVASHDFLEAVDAWMVRANENSGITSDLQELEQLVAAFMRAALAQPLASSASERNARGLARMITMRAAALRSYNPLAAELHRIFAPAIQDGFPSFERKRVLADIADAIVDGERVAVVCRSAAIATACREEAGRDSKLKGMIWTNIEGVRSSAPYDRIVVPGWLDRLSMRELADASYGRSLDLLLYPFERRWLERTTMAGAIWEKRIEEATLLTLSDLTNRLRETGHIPDLWDNQTSSGLAPSPNVDASVDGAAEEPDMPEFEKLEARTAEALRRAVFQGRSHQPTAKAQLITFEHPGTYAFLPANGKVIVLTVPTDGIVLAKATGDAEKILFRKVTSLETGCLLALPVGGDRDLLDVRADRFLQAPAQVRWTADVWRRAIRRYMERVDIEFTDIAQHLARAGVKRHVATIRCWFSVKSTVAPRGYREVLPALARLTADSELLTNLANALQAVDLIYRARAKAAQTIIAELFSGQIDLDAPELSIEHGQSKVRYALHRVQRIGEVCDVPHEVVGRLQCLITPHADPCRSDAIHGDST